MNTEKTHWGWSNSWERAHEPGFSSVTKSSSLRAENCYFLEWAQLCLCSYLIFPVHSSTIVLPASFLRGYIIMQINIVSLFPLSGTARFPDESCLFWIRLNLVSWILLGMKSFSYPWPTFCDSKSPFTVSTSILENRNSWKHCFLLPS